MIDAGRDICAAVSIPVIGDGDTGYGNAMNVKRTVKGYAQVKVSLNSACSHEIIVLKHFEMSADWIRSSDD